MNNKNKNIGQIKNRTRNFLQTTQTVPLNIYQADLSHVLLFFLITRQVYLILNLNKIHSNNKIFVFIFISILENRQPATIEVICLDVFEAFYFKT